MKGGGEGREGIKGFLPVKEGEGRESIGERGERGGEKIGEGTVHR